MINPNDILPDPHHFGAQYAQFLLVAMLIVTFACIAFACFFGWLKARGTHEQQRQSVPIYTNQRGCLASFDRGER